MPLPFPEPPASRQQAVHTHNLRFLRRYSQQPVRETPPAAFGLFKVDIGPLPPLFGNVKCPRRNPGETAKMTLHIVQHGGLHSPPVPVSHQRALVRRPIVPGQLVETQIGLNGGERKHRKRQQCQRDRRQPAAQGALPQIRNPQCKGHDCRRDPPHVLLVHTRCGLLQTSYLVRKPGHHDHHCHPAQAQNYKRQKDDVRRTGQLERGMHPPQRQEHGDENPRESYNPSLDVRKPEKQPLAEERKRQQQHEIENDPPHRVVGCLLHLGVAARLQPPRLPRRPDEPVVVAVFQVTLRLQKGGPRAVVQPGKPLVLHAVARQLLHPYVIHDPHVPRRAVGRQGNDAPVRDVACTHGPLHRRCVHPPRSDGIGQQIFRRVDQQVLDSEQPAAHQDLDPLPRRGECHRRLRDLPFLSALVGDVLEAVLDRFAVVPPQHLHVVQHREITRIHNLEKAQRPAPEKHPHHFVVPPPVSL